MQNPVGSASPALGSVESEQTRSDEKFIQRWMRAEIAIAVTVALFGVLLLWNPSGLYLWLKAFHVIAVIAWMAGMLYLPRLFVYHCEAEAGSKQSETFKVMERRLLRAIINPAMIATWVLGLWLAFERRLLQVRLAARQARAGADSLRHCTGFYPLRARIRGGSQVHSQRFYRIINEVPAVLMVGIVILVIVKPF